MNVVIYLRKSRADMEAEKSGEFETLDRHKSTLLTLARDEGLNVIDIKEEIVSGESIIHRPKMLELLKEVELKKYDAVLVMDMDRLGRGDMKDQGIILETFKNSKTKIMTPRKTYDLTDEFDEEYSEFEAFMARKELKLITRRMQRGRIKSIEEGNYIGAYAPFGYDAVNINKRERILVPNEQADIVRTIYDLYINENMGCNKISDYLNNRGFLTARGSKWYRSAVSNVIKNKVYCGYIQWQKKDYIKPKGINKKITVKTKPVEEWIEAKGKHEPIVSEEIWSQAQKILNGRTQVSYSNALRNPFAGIIKCKVCGKPMHYRPYTENDYDYLFCTERCGNKSSRFEFIEKAFLDALIKVIDIYSVEFENDDLNEEDNDNQKQLNEKALIGLNKELEELNKQKNKLFDFLERGVYDEDTFLERSQVIKNRTDEISKNIKNINAELKIIEKNNNQIVSGIKKVLENYPITESVEEKNQLLKSVVDKAIYFKRKDQRLDEFELYVKLKLTED
jgi:site-specific DNA recombinase